MKSLSNEKMEKVQGGDAIWDCSSTLMELDPNYGRLSALWTCYHAFQ